MIDFKKFFKEIKPLLGAIEQREVVGCETLTKAFFDNGNTNLHHLAYLLGTTWHETAHTMQPIEELGGVSYFHGRYDINGSKPKIAKALGNSEAGDGVKYKGRGYVQITGRTNYSRAAKICGADMLANPKLACVPMYAAKIAIDGMTHGWFTGKKFSHYDLADGGFDYVSARRIINGTDKASLIASHAKAFYQALT